MNAFTTKNCVGQSVVMHGKHESIVWNKAPSGERHPRGGGGVHILQGCNDIEACIIAKGETMPATLLTIR